MSTYHYVDLFEEDGYRRLLKSLRLRAEQIGAAKVSTQAESISLPDIQKDTLVEIGGDASSTDYVTEKNVREAVEKAEREKTELEAREKLAREDVEREKAEKLALEILERETKEKAGRGDAAEKSAHEKVEREAKQDLTHGKTGSAVGKKKSTGKLKYFAFAVLGLFFIVGIFYFAAFVISQIARSSASPVTEFVTTTGEDSTTLVYIPEGEFIMGSNVGESNESPVHKVYLDAFWISHTEITNQQYAICVEAGVCEPPSSMSSSTRPDYYGNPDFDYYPVIYVSWDKANRYCEVWAKGDLPTEAQWEKAARGTDALIYPWGNDAPNDGLLNYNSILEDTTLAFNVGVNGVYDMAGNVWEWVNDWYDEAYYQSSPYSNPVGPDTGKFRVLRGGSWSSNDESVRSSFRYWYVPAITSSSLGFRCVRNNSQ